MGDQNGLKGEDLKNYKTFPGLPEAPKSPGVRRTSYCSAHTLGGGLLLGAHLPAGGCSYKVLAVI